MINSLPEYQAIIVANGSVIDRKDILRLNNTFIIATDGSYAKCKRLKIVPNLIIGDMDSITDQNYEGILYQYIDNQDNTDLEKAIIYCKSHNFDKILVLGVFGGEVDHSLNNIMLMAKYAKQNMQFTMFDQYQGNKLKIAIVLSESSVKFNCPKNSLVSILPLPIATVSTVGLKWELNDTALGFDSFASARNISIKSIVEVNCFSGKVIVVIDCKLENL